ncbi:MAG: hypothetical protein JW900_07250 [Anaerolineae bacterium]|nr:hypothetical protein [Anaerolineae bacterium]
MTQYVAVLEIDGVEVFRSPARDEARQARADAEEHLAMLRSRGEVGG